MVSFTLGHADNVAPKDGQPQPVAVYAEEPDHLWNRVHTTLLVRTGPDGKDYGRDRLEPLLWSESDYLLNGKPGDRAVAVLQEFDREHGETRIDDPVKRAVFQRDLWLVSNWLTGRLDTEARQRLERPLNAAIRRLALTPRHIAELPDNYAAAAASRKYPDRFDPERPEQAYLPPDLFSVSSPWVCVGPTDRPAARFHLADPVRNSVFLVFLKLPGGREKTLDFLKRLAALDELIVPNTDEKSRDSALFLPHPRFPAWPKGTEAVLVRRALLVDVNGRIAASPLTESIQIRVITSDTPPLTAEVLNQAAARRPPAEWQAAFEFQLRRADLFAKTAGGLRDVSGERDFKTGFNSHAWDEFDRESRGGTFPERSQPFETNRASCGSCHNYPGVYSFNSVPEFAFGGPFRPAGSTSVKRPLIATTVSAVERQAIKWKEEQPAWAAFAERFRTTSGTGEPDSAGWPR